MSFGTFDKTYSEYYGFDPEIINKKTPSLTFENVINEIKPLKNHELLERMYKLYKPKNMSRTSKLSKQPAKKISKKISKNISKNISKRNQGSIKQFKLDSNCISKKKKSLKKILKKTSRTIVKK